MASKTVKQILAYSLLIVGFLVVRKYIKMTSQVPPPAPGPNTFTLAAAIIERTADLEYLQHYFRRVPPTDQETRDEVAEQIQRTEEDLLILMDDYIQESRVDLEGKEFLVVKDARGRGVRISLKYKGKVEERRDQRAKPLVEVEVEDEDSDLA